MADGYVQVPADGAGKKVDAEELVVGANTVERQRVRIGGSGAAELAKVATTDPGASDPALVVRNIPSGTQPVSVAAAVSAKATPIAGSIVDENGNVLPVKVKNNVIAASGTTAFIAAVGGKRIRILAYRLQASNVNTAVVTVKFYDTQGTPAQIVNSPQWELDKREGVVATAAPGAFEFESAVGQGVQVNLSGAQQTLINVQYVEVA